MPKKNHIIKGYFFSLDSSLVWLIFSAVLGFICLYNIIFETISDPTKFNEILLSSIGFFAISAFHYWIMSDQYYYYFFGNKKLIIKSMLKNFYREFCYDKIIKVNFYGIINMSKITGNTIEIVYLENDKNKYHRYHSRNLKYEHWIELIKKLEDLGIEWHDPNKEFFMEFEIISK